MNITVICDVLGIKDNGTSVAADGLITSMRSRGHDVRVVCCDGKRKGARGYYVLPERSFPFVGGIVRRAGVALASPVEDIVFAAVEGADVVHCMLPFKTAALAADLAGELGIPVTAGFHCTPETVSAYLRLEKSALLSRMLYRRYRRRLYAKARCVHYPTEFIRREYERIAGHTEGRVISNGVSPDLIGRIAKTRPSDGRFVVLSTGRYSREKRQDVLIRAVGMSALRERIVLVLAGGGPQEERYRRLAARCGADVRFGYVPPEEMPALVRSADLYVHPAYVESEGIACLEAIGCGIPIVVSDSPRSAARLYARDERSLFSADSPASLASRIDYWLTHDGEREKAGEYYASCGLARSRDDCMADMERMFADVAGGKA